MQKKNSVNAKKTQKMQKMRKVSLKMLVFFKRKFEKCGKNAELVFHLIAETDPEFLTKF
jgi:hypothetical protein